MNANRNTNRSAACVMENLEGRQFFSVSGPERDPQPPPPSEVTYTPYAHMAANRSGSTDLVSVEPLRPVDSVPTNGPQSDGSTGPIGAA